ncbi:MAG: hypothetical protein AABY22_25155 [Nanoarchaeota archaeon]
MNTKFKAKKIRRAYTVSDSNLAYTVSKYFDRITLDQVEERIFYTLIFIFQFYELQNRVMSDFLKNR